MKSRGSRCFQLHNQVIDALYGNMINTWLWWEDYLIYRRTRLILLAPHIRSDTIRSQEIERVSKWPINWYSIEEWVEVGLDYFRYPTEVLASYFHYFQVNKTWTALRPVKIILGQSIMPYNYPGRKFNSNGSPCTSSVGWPESPYVASSTQTLPSDFSSMYLLFRVSTTNLHNIFYHPPKNMMHHALAVINFRG